MADNKVCVELVPLVKISWPDGRTFTFSATDLEQFVYTLLIEGLLGLSLPDRKTILSGLELELITDHEGMMVLRPTGIADVRGASK